ncbi:MAG: redoxin domain-containing protein [Candidatus Aenigmarchaeota archaeon]|nr:redoxin domain-containing protein [Candidatus Aenigmarchaeota archaeon]
MFFSSAPELRDLEGWINSAPLTMKGLQGKVVLLDFWTYSCVNCLRTLPHLKRLHGTYAKHGLVLIGVHTPEFAFEREAGNVAAAVKRLGIPYPVALDSRNTTWKLYGNRYWPRQTLVDHRGRVAWEHTGEGGYEDLETWVQKLLRMAGVDVKEEASKEAWRSAFQDFDVTREIYAGSERNPGLGSSGVCGADGVCRYLDQAKQHERDVLYPSGEWVQRAEFLVATGKEAQLALRYRAKEVNAVLNGPGMVDVRVDGKKRPPIKVDRPAMYTLATHKEAGEHEVVLHPQGKISVYAFTFG